MNTRRVITGLVGAAATIAALWAYAYRPPVAAIAAAPKNAPVTPIVDGTAIDFSSGKPVVTATDADKASMDAAVKQIDDAAKSVTFKADPAPKN
ncbi:MAG TPA: hypothetical protein VFE25_09395 [Opitutaceae bacterium]|nr:hypothetical protein [Opitutaceae bacterium]